MWKEHDESRLRLILVDIGWWERWGKDKKDDEEGEEEVKEEEEEEQEERRKMLEGNEVSK